MNQRSRRCVWPASAALCGAILGAVSGCEPPGPELVEVTGVVTFEGAPVEEGTVLFLHDQTQDSRQANLAEGGTYELEVMPGSHKIAIEPIIVETPGGPDSPPSSDYKKVENIPRRYRATETSGFTANVEGPSTFSFPMTKGGK